MYQYLIIFFLLVNNLGSIAFADTQTEIMDIRLANGQMEYAKGNKTIANRYLLKNLKSKKIHFPTYSFLANTYLQNNKFSKAIKVYYLLIKKSVGTKLLASPNLDKLKTDLSNTKRPAGFIAEGYFSIANIYFKMRKNDHLSEKYRKKLAKLAYKYFYICKYFKYKYSTVSKQLGILEREQGKNKNAIANFLDSKESSQNSNNEDKSKDILLSSALAEEGRYDAATILLKNIYLSPSSERSAREYAGSYLENLSNRYFGFIAGINYGNHSNVRQTAQKDRKDESLNVSMYREITANAFLSQGFADHYKIKMIGGYNELSHTISDFKAYTPETAQTNVGNIETHDSQELKGEIVLEYNNITKAIAKLVYRHELYYYRAAAESKYLRIVRRRDFEPGYHYSLNSGIISYHALFSIYDYYAEEKMILDHYEYGLGITYVPIAMTNYFNPSYSFFLKSREEQVESRTFVAKLNFSNHFVLSDNFTALLSLEYLYQKNPDFDASFHQSKIKTIISYSTPINGLIINMKANSLLTNEDGITNPLSDEVAVSWKLSLGITYSF